MSDFKRWMLNHGARSDFNLVTINRRHVTLAQRIKHGEKGVAVSLLGAVSPLNLTATFDEFDAWLNGESRADYSMTPQPKDADEMKADALALVDRIKQMKADRRSIFGVEGDGVDVLLNDCWDTIEALTRTPPSASIEPTPEMIEVALNERFGGYWEESHKQALEIGILLERARQKDQS
jgi:hypothetical protein